MKTWKRALALVLALVMALSLVALPSFAEGEETGGGTAATQPEWPHQGAICIRSISLGGTTGTNMTQAAVCTPPSRPPKPLLTSC